MCFSSARPENVQLMLQACSILPAKLPNGATHKESSEAETTAELESSLDLLRLKDDPRRYPPVLDVWARDKLNLSPRDYDSKVDTIKDLQQVWQNVGEQQWDQSNTLLIDDSLEKAVCLVNACTAKRKAHLLTWLFSDYNRTTSCLVQASTLFQQTTNHIRMIICCPQSVHFSY